MATTAINRKNQYKSYSSEPEDLSLRQGSHGQGKVREKCKKFKVREKSGNFEISQGNLKKYQKSGKSQGISGSEEEILK